MENRNFARLVGRILLVEDEELNQIVVKQLLQLIGCEVDVAGSGKQTLELLTDNDANYDVVLMDIGLPDISGLEVTKQLRKTSCKLQNVPVVALTGHVSTAHKDACIESGMNDFIEKPASKDTLYEHLKIILQKIPVDS